MQRKGGLITKRSHSLLRCLGPIIDDEEKEHVDEKQVQLDVDRSLNAYPQGKDQAEIKLLDAKLCISKGGGLPFLP